MRRHSTTKGNYQKSSKERQVFEFDQLPPDKDERSRKLISLLNRPWGLIKQGGRLGVKGAKRFLSIVLLFSISNAIMFFYAIGRIFSVDFEFSHLLTIFFVLIIGVAMTFYAAYRTYQYLLVDTIRVIYGNLTSFFQKLCEQIIDKVEALFQGKTDPSNQRLNKALDFGKLVNSTYQKIPRIIQKGIILILRRIPLLPMLADLQAEISAGNKAEASKKLHHKMDVFITDNIFGNNSTKWVWWLLPLNVLILIVLIHAYIG